MGTGSPYYQAKLLRMIVGKRSRLWRGRILQWVSPSLLPSVFALSETEKYIGDMMEQIMTGIHAADAMELTKASVRMITSGL